MPRATALVLCLLAAGAMQAADLSGTWTGSLEVKRPDGEMVAVPVTAELQHKREGLAGTISSSGRTGEIRNAKFEGDQISFDVIDPESDGPAKFRVTAKADRIEGEMLRQSSEGETRTGTIALTRAK